MAGTTTNNGLEWIGDKTIGKRSGEIEKIALGTGSGNKDVNATSLANEVFRGEISGGGVSRVETNTTGGFDIEAVVTGGLEVPGGTEITEIALFSTDDTLIVIDEYTNPVSVPVGEKRSFKMTFTPIQT